MISNLKVSLLEWASLQNRGISGTENKFFAVRSANLPVQQAKDEQAIKFDKSQSALIQFLYKLKKKTDTTNRYAPYTLNFDLFFKLR